MNELDMNSIAIVGMSIRVPGAASLAEYWNCIRSGFDPAIELNEEELQLAGVPESVYTHPAYVKRTVKLENVESFDADFFDILPAEAEITDPQHRLMLECAYEAIEGAGYNPLDLKDPVGIYAGVGISNYLHANIFSGSEFNKHVSDLQVLLGNDKSYACTRISHKLDLRGPCMAIDTACSTSLVAVHQACKALLLYECDMALAGGARVIVPHGCGYQYQPGSILSRDGTCRPFDAQASGTIQGSGAGMVLLKRLSDALEDGDVIHAVIRGSAVNNDGSEKIGYSAPGVRGQASVITQALGVSGVEPETVGYIEAHGTGTALGDPIEIKALGQAFDATRPSNGFSCAIGSLKANYGHLDVAAGVAGLIKTALMLKHEEIPPSLHYTAANPEIDFSSSPFYVNTELKPWKRGEHKRRAGVSSFGIGGTNAHVILEEAPARLKNENRPDRYQVFCLSAKSPAALDELREKFADALDNDDLPLSDIAYTLQTGRPHFNCRHAVVAETRDELLSSLGSQPSGNKIDSTFPRSRTGIAFMFTGQGAQYTGMCHALYDQFKSFRTTLDEIDEYMREFIPHSLKDILWNETNRERINETRYTQPALFAVEYSVAMLWRSFGVNPHRVIGHSVGEIAAACFAGMFNLRDGVKLVCERARLMQEFGEAGGMLVVLETADVVTGLLSGTNNEISIAAINGPRHVVVAGAKQALVGFANDLKKRKIATLQLDVSHAFHSKAMDTVTEPLRAVAETVEFVRPDIPVVSNLSGDVTSEEQLSADYWARQMREPVNFLKGVESLATVGIDTFIEVGPGTTLLNLGQAVHGSKEALWLSSTERLDTEGKLFRQALAKYYENGGDINWEGMHDHERCGRVLLPTYPFQRRRYWTLPEKAAFRDGQSKVIEPHPAYDTTAGESDVQPLNPSSQSLSGAGFSTALDTVSRIWKELLGIQQISPEDNFFSLGGHSLLIVKMYDKLKQALSVELPLYSLVENPTLAEFSSQVERHRKPESEDRDSPDCVANIEDRFKPFPLVEMQQAFLVGRKTDFGSGGVSTHLYFELTPENFDFNQFENAINTLIHRHDMLRAIVCSETEQRVLPDVGRYKVEYYDHSHNPQQLSQHLSNLRESMSHQVLDEGKWPLFDFRVTRTSELNYIVHVSIDLLMLDVRSNQVLFRDLDLIYLEQLEKLPKLNIHYRDYVLKRQAIKSGPAAERAREYWLSRIPGLPMAPDLPLAQNPGELERPRFVRRLKVMDVELSKNLRARALAMGVTPSVLLMTAYSLVLSRWSKQPAFTLNLTMFDRMPLHPDVNELVGDFTTVSLLAVDFGHSHSFRDYAHRIQQQLWRDAEHKAFDGVDVLREMTRFYKGEQQVAMPVVFTSALPLDSDASRELPENSLLAGLNADFSVSQTPQVWIDHIVSEEAGQILLCWDAIEDLFPRDMLENMFNTYTGLVDKLARDDSIWDQAYIDLLPAEQRRLREEINNSTFVENADSNLVRMFIDQAERQPKSVAVIDEEVTLSFEALYRYSAHWAKYLVENGLEPGQTVAILQEKGWRQVVSAYAVLMAGGAYVPIDATQPRDRQLKILELSGSRFMLSQDSMTDDVQWPDVILIGAVEKFSDGLPVVEFRPVSTPPDQVAYVLFTSGSTGVPKGVAIGQQSVYNTMLDCQERFAIGPGDRALALCAFNFDMSIFDIFGMLTAGAGIVIPRQSELFSMDRLITLMQQHNVSVINSVPAMVQMIIDGYEVLDETMPESMRLIMMAGDFIPVTLPERIWAQNRDISVQSLGGPTETTIFSIAYPVEEVDTSRASIPYGKPMRNRSCYVFDEAMNDCPDWVAGEIYMGRNNYIAQGYWNDADKTAHSFITHPHNGERLFRTGDLGRYWPDGNIEILGRKDFQVKINGLRVELGEIESVLQKSDYVKRSIALVREGENNRKSLIAYVQIDKAKTPQDYDFSTISNSLKESCLCALPKYMVPHYFVEIGELPLSANGKVDRKALPEPVLQNTQSHDNGLAKTATETQLLEIWRDLFQAHTLKTSDNFFEIGGHSLIAALLVTRIKQELGTNVSVRQIFDNPTVSGLAKVIGDICGKEKALPVFGKTDRVENFPLSYAQQRLWFVNQYESVMEGHAAAYNMPLLWHLRGRLDKENLHQSLQVLLNRHAVLRTKIVARDGIPVGVETADVEIPWQEVDLTHSDTPEKYFSEAIQSERKKPFDLTHSPLLRAILFNWGGDRYSLFLNMHHIVTDAWSAGIISRSIAECYNQLAGGDSLVPESGVFQYKDYATWEKEVWDSGLMETCENYWLEELKDLPGPLALFHDQPALVTDSHLSDAISFQFDNHLTAKVKAFSQKQQLTPFMLLLANFKLLLSFYSGENDIIVGTDTANRNEAELADIVGYFINQLAIRSRVDQNMNVGQYLDGLREKVLAAYEHESMPFDRLIDKLNISRDLVSTPVFQVKMNFHSVKDEDVSLRDLDVRVGSIDYDTAHYNLVLTFKQLGERLVGTLQFKKELYERSSMESFVGHYRQLLTQLMESADRPLSRLNYLSRAEYIKTLEYGRSKTTYRIADTLDGRFSEVVDVFRHRTALTEGEKSTCYEELETRANQLATHLREQGVNQGEKIALYLDRGAAQVVAILGILKAGAIYVPLEANAPPDRLQYILEDAEPVLLLSESETLKRKNLNCKARCLLLDELDLSGCSGEKPDHVRHGPDSPAYVIYTSGTTGRPNGVVITHQQVLRLFEACRNHFNFNEEDVWTLFHSYVFDFSVWEIWGALLFGGRLVIVPRETARSADAFWKLIKAEKVTVLNQTPSAFKALTRVAQADNNAWLSLRKIIFGGEALDSSAVETWFESFGDSKPELVNMYGITETTVHVTLHPLNRDNIKRLKNSIGKPLTDLEVYVLDKYQRPVPVGVAGELYVAGPGVTSGYLNNPALSAVRIIPSNFPGVHDRLYRTGDLVAWTESGELAYIGRIDHQIKIRGHRIELGEIENAMLRHPQVTNAVVRCDRDVKGNPVLTAFWQSSEYGAINSIELRNWLKTWLADYMLPTVFVELKEIPLTVNGKVDRRALPKTNISEINKERYKAPETETEKQLVRTIEKLLQVDNVGANHNFFELGGHSLLATQLVSRIEKTFSTRLEIRDIFENESISDLAALITDRQSTARKREILFTDQGESHNKEEFLI